MTTGAGCWLLTRLTDDPDAKPLTEADRKRLSRGEPLESGVYVVKGTIQLGPHASDY